MDSKTEVTRVQSPLRAPDEGVHDVELAHPFASSSSTLPAPIAGDVHRGAPSREFSVEIVHDVADLADEVDAWRNLLRDSLESNVFYGPDVFLSACQHLTAHDRNEIVLIKGRDRSAPTKPPAWCGFFPLVRRSKWRGIAMNLLTLHSHDYCFLRTPLVRADAAREVMDAFWGWVAGESKGSLVEMPDQTGDGIYHAHLFEGLLRAGLRPTIGATRVRAILCRAENADMYLRDRVSGGKLKELRRLERRLSEQEGGVQFSALSPHDEIKPALDTFLEVERSGWKGREGTAIACRPADEAFFRQAAAGLHAAGELRLHWLRGRDRTIAAKCNFIAGAGSYAFKIGFAEEYARFSPGVQLEVDNIRRFHAESELAWMDSCADPDHPMIDHLWKDRRSIHSWWIPLNRWGATAIALYPWVASLRKGLRGPVGGKGEKS